MTKLTMVRLPDWAGKEVEKIAGRKGHPFATVIREIVVEYFEGGEIGVR
jgi:predicted DNA-binding protein